MRKGCRHPLDARYGDLTHDLPHIRVRHPLNLWNRVGDLLSERAVYAYAAWVALGRPRGRLERRTFRALRRYARLASGSLTLRYPDRIALVKARRAVEENAAYALERAEAESQEARAELDARYDVTAHLEHRAHETDR
jgi:hypothetical protein